MAFWSHWFGQSKPEGPSKQPEATPPLITATPPKFPYELVMVPGNLALDTLWKLRHESGGFTPVLLGDREDVQRIAEYSDFVAGKAEDVLRAAEAISPIDWFQQRQAEDPEYYQDEPGDWPYKDLEPHSISSHLDIVSHDPKPQVYIAKVPTANSWEVPAYLQLGGWNECPPPEALVAISKYWHERYGAEIVSATGDVLEYVVSRPPVTREAALELAQEQFLFCGDLIHQGMGNVTNLAAILLEGQYWHFWWD
jgi:Domain of unknown function (DUF4253)